jgi:2-(1,2-epoxy-1,2-dihydrophenyl)acetyl-CoA isomerase
MIWEAVPDASFEAHWRSKAAQLAAGPTTAYASAKKAIRESWDNTFEDQLSLEAREQGKCGQSRDFKEGVIAFMQKRPAQFEGR